MSARCKIAQIVDPWMVRIPTGDILEYSAPRGLVRFNSLWWVHFFSLKELGILSNTVWPVEEGRIETHEWKNGPVSSSSWALIVFYLTTSCALMWTALKPFWKYIRCESINGSINQQVNHKQGAALCVLFEFEFFVIQAI